MDQKVGIAFCCERGELERITMMMVESLLKYGELTDHFELFCFCPRPAFRPGSQVLKKFQELGIKVIDQPLNTKFSFYPLMNKVVALKYLEENTTLDRLIFFDSDLIILNKIPDKEMMEYDVALQSDFVDMITAIQSNDPFYPFWTRLFKLLGIKEFSFTNTFVSGKRIFADWNSGLICYKRQFMVASKWFDNISICFDHYHWRKLEYYFLEQATLAVTLQQLKLPVYRLKPGFNYPICSQNEIIKENKVTEMDNLHIIHYLRYTEASIESLKKIDPTNEKIKWVEQTFRFHELIDVGLVRMVKDFIHRFRQANIQKILYFYNRFSRRIK